MGASFSWTSDERELRDLLNVEYFSIQCSPCYPAKYDQNRGEKSCRWAIWENIAGGRTWVSDISNVFLGPGLG